MYDLKFVKESFIWTAVFLVLFTFGYHYIQQNPEQMSARIAMAAGLSALGFFGSWVELRQIRRLDELHRKIYFEACFVGLTFMLNGLIVSIFLSDLLVEIHRMALVVIAMFGVGFLAGYVRARRRYL